MIILGMIKNMKNFILILVLIIACSVYSFSQVSINPHVIFLDMKTRTANMKVMNNSDSPKEVAIDLKFGILKYDSLGSPNIKYGDSLPEANMSAIPYVKVFPKKLVLKAKEEQVIRFIVGSMGDAPDGTYISRIIVKSQDAEKEIDSSFKDDNMVKAKFKIIMSMVGALILRKGPASCSITLNDAKIITDTSAVKLLLYFDKTGNTPFFGNCIAKFYDENNNLALEHTEITTLYSTTPRAYKLTKGKLKNGKYRVEVLINNDSEEVPKDFRVKMEAIKKEYTLEVKDLK
jgi:hypothetical protein